MHFTYLLEELNQTIGFSKNLKNESSPSFKYYIS